MISQDFGIEIPVVDWSNGNLAGKAVRENSRTLRQMEGLYADIDAWKRMDLNQIVYRARWYAPVSEGTEGGLVWGTTTIEPGRVGDEYFMTHGHCHVKRNRTEFYCCVRGSGILILMDDSRRTWMNRMAAGTINFVPGSTAHRVANVGDSPLTFVACWPSDAGHDYEGIRRSGFGARVVARNGDPLLLSRG
jgi:glucose-6-phosphate isomerase